MEPFIWRRTGGLQIIEGQLHKQWRDISKMFTSRVGNPRYNYGPWVAHEEGAEQGRPYEPLRRRRLHRRFAKIRTDEQLLRFANEHGRLTAPLPIPIIANDGTEWHGEPVAFWKDEVAAMASVVEKLDALAKKDSRRLSSLVSWEYNPTVVSVRAFADEIPRTVAREDFFAYRLKRWERGELSGPVRAYIADKINERILERMLLFVRAHPPRMGYQPTNLITALWVLAAQEFTGAGRQPVLCKGCGQPFAPLHGRQVYCTQACRQRAYRLRKAGQV